MKKALGLAVASTMTLLVGACVVEVPPPAGGGAPGDRPAGVAAMEETCRVAVAREAGARRAVVINSEPYQGGGRFVRVGVGQASDVWQCVVLGDGTVAEVRYVSAGTGVATQLPGAAPGRPAVGSEYDLTEFQGARAGQAEMGIRSLGYEPIRTQGLTTWWFNRSTGACAEITTSNGRYSSVNMLAAEDC